MAFNLGDDTISNTDFRRVIYTTKHQQLVLMSVDDYINNEVHPDNDQFFRLEKGRARFTIGNNEVYHLTDEDSITVPAGTYHMVENFGSEALKMYVIYSPPVHKPGTVDKYPTEHD